MSKTSDAVKIALISGLVSILPALITVSVQWKAGAAEEKARIEAEAAEAAKDREALPKAVEGVFDKIKFKTLSASVPYNGDGTSRTDKEPGKGYLEADVCVLTKVSSYGGASKTCSLTRSEEGWVLIATARKATASCEAIRY